MLRSCSGIGALVLAVALLCCAEERPTRSSGVPILPATSIASTLVVESSATIAGTLNGDGTYGFDFGMEPLFLSGEYDDIALGLSVDIRSMPESFEVLDTRGPTWRSIDGASTASGSYVCNTACLAHISRLASEIRGCTPFDLLSTNGEIRIKSDSIRSCLARLVKYSPDYRVVKLLSTRTFSASDLSFQNGHLYALSDHLDRTLPGPYRVFDSLVIADVSGIRQWSTGFPGNGSFQGAFDGDSYWIIGSTYKRLERVDSSGQVLGRLDWPFGFARAMTWANGTLWFAMDIWDSGDPIFEVDIDSSLAIGKVVANARFISSREQVDEMTSDDKGIILICGDRVLKYTYKGTLLSDVAAPLGTIEGVAWGSESIWVLHHGPAGARTDATLLTRFSLE